MCAERKSGHTKFKAFTANLALLLGSVLMTLLTLEGIFRVLGMHAHELYSSTLVLSSNPRYQRQTNFGFFPYSVLRLTYDSDPRGYFDEGHGIDHRFNSVGWRDVEHSLKKPAGVFRILGLGDSFLFGQGVRLEDVCLKRLERLLSKDSQGRTVETINAGLSAMDTVDERDLLSSRGLPYAPDLVIVHFVLNDAEFPKWSLPRPGPDFEALDWLSQHSSLWGWSWQRVRQSVRGHPYVREYLDAFRSESTKWDRCRRALADIATICRAHEIDLLVVIFPFFVELDGDYPFQPIHDTVRAHCESLKVDVLDLRDHYLDYRGPELWVHPTDQHPNELAHELAAQAIARHLRRQR